jgi:hypothetical protein
MASKRIGRDHVAPVKERRHGGCLNALCPDPQMPNGPKPKHFSNLDHLTRGRAPSGPG